MIIDQKTIKILSVSNQRQLDDWNYHLSLVRNNKPIELSLVEESFHKAPPNLIQRAFRLLFERHDSLRTAFPVQNEKIKQVIYPYQEKLFSLSFIDISKSSEKYQRRVLHLAKQKVTNILRDIEKPPLAKGYLFRIGPENSLLVFSAHHIISDHYAIDLFRSQLKLYVEALMENSSFIPEPLPIQLDIFLSEKRKKLSGNYMDKFLNYWHNKFHDYLKPIDHQLLYNNPHFKHANKYPGQQEIADAKKNIEKALWRSFTYNSDRKDEIELLADNFQISKQSILTAITFLTLHIAFRRNEIISVGVVDGRMDPVAKQLIGNLYGNIFMKSSLKPNQTFKELVKDIYWDFMKSCKYMITEFQHFDGYSFRTDCEFFINLMKIDKYVEEDAHRHKTHHDDNHYYSFGCFVHEFHNGFAFTWCYQTDIYTEEVIEFISSVHERLFIMILENPETSIDQLISNFQEVAITPLTSHD